MEHMFVLSLDFRGSGNSRSDSFVPRCCAVKDNPRDAAFADRADPDFLLKVLIQRQPRDNHYSNSADDTWSRPAPADRPGTCDCCPMK